MRQNASVLMAVLVLGVGVSILAAQEKGKTMTTIGPVEKISGDMLIVSSGGKMMEFVTNTETEVKVATGGAKQQEAKQAGKKGLKITEVVHVGDQVFVRYADVAGKMVASEIEVRERRPQSALPVK